MYERTRYGDRSEAAFNETPQQTKCELDAESTAYRHNSRAQEVTGYYTIINVTLLPLTAPRQMTTRKPQTLWRRSLLLGVGFRVPGFWYCVGPVIFPPSS